jgi:DNA-binding NtrC family response regulator
LPKRILVVDDEHNALVALAKILREDGYDVVVAANEEQALKRLNRWSFDLIITDLFLLHSCCIKLLNKINSVKHHVPVILMTAHENIGEYINEASLEGMTRLFKPIRYDELKRIIGGIEAESERESPVKKIQ